MNKIKYVSLAVLTMALAAVSTFAQAGAAPASNQFDVDANKALAAGFGFALAAGLAAIGQGLVGSRAAEGTARNPGASGQVLTITIISLALIESLVLFALVITFVVVRPST